VLLVTVLILAFLIDIPSCCSSTRKDVEIVSVRTGRMINEVWAPNCCFFHVDDVSVQVTAENYGVTQEATVIFVSAFDSMNYPIGFSEVNATFSGGETRIVCFSAHIPSWARVGRCYVNAGTESGTGVTVYFTVLAGTASYLTLQTLSRGREINDMIIWFDGTPYPSPVTIPLAPGTHSVAAELRIGSLEDEYGSLLYVCDFSSWEDGSTLNLRTVNVTENLNVTFTANYIKHRYVWQPCELAKGLCVANIAVG
jgi:hypothetical protein